jgi:hypothetical protein
VAYWTRTPLIYMYWDISVQVGRLTPSNIFLTLEDDGGQAFACINMEWQVVQKKKWNGKHSDYYYYYIYMLSYCQS